jgi:hypothetical protein
MVPFSFFGWQKSVVSASYHNDMHKIKNCALLESIFVAYTDQSSFGRSIACRLWFTELTMVSTMLKLTVGD